MATPAPQGDTAHPDASCAVDADGSLTVTLRPEQLTDADSHVLLRHRGTKGKEAVRVPCTARPGDRSRPASHAPPTPWPRAAGTSTWSGLVTSRAAA
ncbi:hypothetical protein ACFQ2B_11495 [Streptomyces stramineus]